MPANPVHPLHRYATGGPGLEQPALQLIIFFSNKPNEMLVNHNG